MCLVSESIHFQCRCGGSWLRRRRGRSRPHELRSQGSCDRAGREAVASHDGQPSHLQACISAVEPHPQHDIPGPSRSIRGEGKDEVLPVDIKCTKCGKDTQVPPAEKCHSCGGHVCPTCFPRLRATECPWCDDFFREVDAVVPVDLAV